MSERHVCTAENPWREGMGKAVHPDAKQIGDDYCGLAGGGDYERYECPHCKLKFLVELTD